MNHRLLVFWVFFAFDIIILIINQLHISNLIFTDKKFNFKIQKKKIISGGRGWGEPRAT